jgi:hypothetical protein
MDQPVLTTQKNFLQTIMTMRYAWALITAVILVVALSIIGFIATKSIPGDALYAVKTNVVESGATFLHIQNRSKAEYQAKLIKERLREVQALSKKESVSAEAQTAFTNQLQKQSDTLEALIGASIDSSFPKTDVLALLHEFSSVAGAIEVVSENDQKLQTIGDFAEDVRRKTFNTYKDRALSFVQTEETKTVLEYTTAQLQIVRDELTKNTVSYEVSENAETHLDRIDAALHEKDLAKVIVSLGEAYRFIKVEQYSGIQGKEAPTPKPTATSSVSQET